MQDNKRNKINSPLPVVFITVILILSILNYESFIVIFRERTVEQKGANLQTELSSIESLYANEFKAKNVYIDFNGGFNKVIKNKEVNQRILLNNGYLSYLSYEEDSQEKINNILSIDNYLEKLDIQYLYVQTPHIILDDNDNIIPKGYTMYSNQNTDNLLSGLQNKDVAYLDLREKFRDENYKGHDLYFKTDHHWTNEAAFIAHKFIVELLADLFTELDITEKYFDDENYIFEELDVNLLGSHGQRVGLYYAGIDRFNYISPKFNTHFRLEEPSRNYSSEGLFEEVFNYTNSYSKNGFNRGAEKLFLDGNIEYRKITNLMANNNIKVMLINDSFSLPLAPFLAIHLGEVHMYDVREIFGGSTEGLADTFEEVQPDIVIQIRTTEPSL